jgi:hypothetical protein
LLNYAVFPSLRKLTGRVRVVPAGMADASIGKKYERFDQRSVAQAMLRLDRIKREKGVWWMPRQ